jgi:hypothetical protein
MTIIDTSVPEANIGNHVNININPENPCEAVASLDFNEPAVLSYAQVCDLLAEVRTIRRRIEWAMTDYVSVRDMPGQKWHITDKDNWQVAFCNRPIGADWDKNPLLGSPDLASSCKRCIRAYEADTEHPDMEEVLQAQAVQHLEDKQCSPRN